MTTLNFLVTRSIFSNGLFISLLFFCFSWHSCSSSGQEIGTTYGCYVDGKLQAGVSESECRGTYLSKKGKDIFLTIKGKKKKLVSERKPGDNLDNTVLFVWPTNSHWLTSGCDNFKELLPDPCGVPPSPPCSTACNDAYLACLSSCDDIDCYNSCQAQRYNCCYQ